MQDIEYQQIGNMIDFLTNHSDVDTPITVFFEDNETKQTQLMPDVYIYKMLTQLRKKSERVVEAIFKAMGNGQQGTFIWLAQDEKQEIKPFNKCSTPRKVTGLRIGMFKI
jgi:hypothetical protein